MCLGCVYVPYRVISGRKVGVLVGDSIGLCGVGGWEVGGG